MIFVGGKASSVEDGYALATRLLKDGSAQAKFQTLCAAQGGDLSKGLPKATQRHRVTAARAGHLNFINLEKLGLAGVHLGAGRKFQADTLDYAAGLEVLCTQGQAVKQGEALFVLHYSDERRLEPALAALNEGFEIGARPAPRSPLIAKVLK
jgi:thymidine phosphorylase